MFRANPFSYMSTLLLKSSRASLSNRGTCVRPNHLRTQIATLVRITTIQDSNPKQSYAVRVTHQHPSAHATKQKTSNVDVVFAEDDEDADVCWSFQIMEGEDRLNRLLAYAQAFGKHGSGDDYYDQYVDKFQSTIISLCLRRMAIENPDTVKIEEEEDEVWFKDGVEEHGVDEDGVDEDKADEDGKRQIIRITSSNLSSSKAPKVVV